MNDMTAFRTGRHTPSCPTCGRHYGHGPLTVDFGAGTIKSGARTIHAPRRELLLAAALNDAYPAALSNDTALRALYHEDEWDRKASENALYSHSSKLRSRLRKAGIPVTVVHPRALGVALQVADSPGLHSDSPSRSEQRARQLADA